MDRMFAIFQSLTESTSAQRFLFVLGVGATAFMLALGLSFLTVAATDPVRRRLAGLTGKPRVHGRFANAVLRVVEPVSRYVLPAREDERSRMQRQLDYAGFRSANALPLLYALKTGLALAFLFVVVGLTQWLPRMSSTSLLTAALLAAFVGLMLPNYVLDHLVTRRQRRVRNGFPDALDMLVVCVEAGLGLTAAIQRVASELRYSHEELADEFAQVTAEMRAGVDREVALRGLASRTGLEDIRGLVTLLIQTLRFGTSIGETLRVYAEEFRDKRLQKAEEAAAKIGTKLIFPLVLCMFPAFFVVTVGPAIVRFAEAFRQMGSQ